MDAIKGALSSKTVWSGIVGVAAWGAQHLGYTVLPTDAADIVNNIANVVEPLAAIGAIVFRIVATKKVVLGGAK